MCAHIHKRTPPAPTPLSTSPKLDFTIVVAPQVPLPHFRDLARFYPGYSHHGGRYHNHHIIAAIGLNEEDSALLLHDTSALRLSYSLNRIGGRHSLGRQLIRLSKFGHDSVSGADGLEYMFHPIAYGPYLADKYGYPNVTKLHAQDPVSAKRNFWGRQGILRVITYTKKRNLPKGHVALWDCNHFHQSKDWMAGHSLLTVEFWQSPGEWEIVGGVLGGCLAWWLSLLYCCPLFLLSVSASGPVTGSVLSLPVSVRLSRPL